MIAPLHEQSKHALLGVHAKETIPPPAQRPHTVEDFLHPFLVLDGKGQSYESRRFRCPLWAQS